MKKFYLTILMTLLSASVFAQTRITLAVSNTDLKSVVWEIERQSGIKFIYNASDIEGVRIASLNLTDASVGEALSAALKGTNISFEQHEGVYTLIKSTPPPVTPSRQQQPATENRVTVTGRVADNQGQPMVGASIIIVGTTIGTNSLSDGTYSLRMTERQMRGSQLQFSYLGYRTMTVSIGSRTNISVIMEEDTQSVEAVVVTGYGNISRDFYTGSASVISAEDISLRPLASVEDALRGLSPGTLVSSSGQPGEVAQIIMRGMGSMNAGNQPLYVIDGVVWDQENISGNDLSPSNPISGLNPNDIANLTMLKDAASASLYGSRGANGVIVITTKSGRDSEKVNFTLRSQTGFSYMNAHPETVTGRQFADLWTSGQMNFLIQQRIAEESGQSSTSAFVRNALLSELTNLYGDKDGYTYSGYNYNEWMKLARQDFNALYQMPVYDGSYRRYDYFGDDYDKLPSTDWFNEITRPAPFASANLQMQGGSKTFAYYSSLEYFNQQGTIINSSLERYSMRVKLSSESDRQCVNWSLNTYVSQSTQAGPQQGGEAYNSPQYAAINLPSVIAPRLEDGSYNFYFPDNILNTNHNPLASAIENINQKPQTTVNINGSITLNLLDWLKFKSTGAIYYLGFRRRTYYDKDFGSGLQYNGQLTERDVHRRKIVNQNMFFVEKTWQNRHRLNATVGLELEDLKDRRTQFTAINFATDNNPYASAAGEISSYFGEGSGYSMVSLVSKVDYSWRYRYFISGSFRQDHSSRFAPGRRAGNFWSVSGAYRITNEPFMQRFSNWLNNLRFKASYGENGTLPPAYYAWRDVYIAVTYNGEPGAKLVQRGNPELTWEGNRIFNVGMDARLFANRLSVSVEWYNRRSRNLLQDVPVSMTSGHSTMLMNTGAGIQSQGLETQIIASPINEQRFKWDINFNIATLKSTYYGIETQMYDTYSRQIIASGVDVNSWFLREYGGVDKTTGRALFVCIDPETGEKYLDTSSANSPLKVVGVGVPPVSGGFANTFNYDNWEFSFLFSFAWGHHIFDRTSATFTANDGYRYYGVSTSQLDSWSPDNLDGSTPLRVNNNPHSTRTTRYLVKGDYLKLKNVRLQYTLPEKWTKKINIERAAIFVQGENLIRFAYLKDYDPEMSLAGYRHSDVYPTAATITAGITLNF